MQSATAREVAVVGVGLTDFAADWKRVRAGQPVTDSYGYALRAFKRALDDAAIKKQDIDGIIVSKLDYIRTAETLGLDVRHASQAETDQAVIQGVMAIVTGQAECVALIYGSAQKSANTAYGGPGTDSSTPLSYRMYSPWGLTSQGGLYALMTQRYMAQTGLTERQLGHVSVAQRAWASTNENAIMRKPITIDDYLAAKYVVAPLRLFDYAIVNDGGVALILMPTERAKRLAGDRAVVISAMARADVMVDTTSLRPRLMDFYHSGHRAAAERVYGIAGIGPTDIDAVQVYDGFASRIPFALTGFGFTSDDQIGAFLDAGNLGPGGTLPVNTSGGHLSDSYLHGWTHQVESVRQIRGEAGPNQVQGARRVQYISDVGGKVTTMIYEQVSS